MNLDIKSEIIKVASLIPGIHGFASADFNKAPSKLNEKNFLNAVICEESTKGILVKIAIIVNLKINSKIVCEEIVSSITNIFKKNNWKLSEVLVYIRGVR